MGVPSIVPITIILFLNTTAMIVPDSDHKFSHRFGRSVGRCGGQMLAEVRRVSQENRRLREKVSDQAVTVAGGQEWDSLDDSNSELMVVMIMMWTMTRMAWLLQVQELAEENHRLQHQARPRGKSLMMKITSLTTCRLLIQSGDDVTAGSITGRE
jgi:hypothetical protein